MYKLKVGKLSASQLAEALAGKLNIEVGDEIIKGIMMDEDAQRLGIATKGAGDSNVDTRLAELETSFKSLLEGLPLMIETAVKAAMPEPIKLEALQSLAGKIELPEALKGFDPTVIATALTTLSGKVDTFAAQAGQAIATANAVQQEVTAKLAAPPAHGQLTPQMAAMLQSMSTPDPDDPFAGQNVALRSAA